MLQHPNLGATTPRKQQLPTLEATTSSMLQHPILEATTPRMQQHPKLSYNPVHWGNNLLHNLKLRYAYKWFYINLRCTITFNTLLHILQHTLLLKLHSQQHILLHFSLMHIEQSMLYSPRWLSALQSRLLLLTLSTYNSLSLFLVDTQ